jgi:hypothetical protein
MKVQHGRSQIFIRQDMAAECHGRGAPTSPPSTVKWKETTRINNLPANQCFCLLSLLQNFTCGQERFRIISVKEQLVSMYITSAKLEATRQIGIKRFKACTESPREFFTV